MCILFHHSILSEVTLFVTSLIDMSFFTISISVNFGLPLIFFCSLKLNSIFFTGALIAFLEKSPNHLKKLSLIFSSIGATQFLSKFLYFKFYFSLYCHISIKAFSFQLHSLYEKRLLLNGLKF